MSRRLHCRPGPSCRWAQWTSLQTKTEAVLNLHVTTLSLAAVCLWGYQGVRDRSPKGPVSLPSALKPTKPKALDAGQMVIFLLFHFHLMRCRCRP